MSKPLLPGDMAPWFKGQLVDGPVYNFDSIAGRPVVLLFFGGATWPGTIDALKLVAANRAAFNDLDASFFGISIEAADTDQKRIAPQRPGIRFFNDADREISRQYGALSGDGDTAQYAPHWLLLDRTLRVAATAPLNDGASILAALREVQAEQAADIPAPVLVVPRVFEPAMCRKLIDHYAGHGGIESGFMREEGGMTVTNFDDSFKRRSDCHIEDAAFQAEIAARLSRFLVPAIQRAFQFNVTQIERFVVACYDSADGGHFRAHRDDTTAGTAHRRFACTINLNTEEYEGGDLSFPEYGPRTYRAPTGGAVIFSCSMMHQAHPVTSGKRYAFLPFLFDEAGAKIRAENMKFIVSREREAAE